MATGIDVEVVVNKNANDVNPLERYRHEYLNRGDQPVLNKTFPEPTYGKKQSPLMRSMVIQKTCGVSEPQHLEDPAPKFRIMIKEEKNFDSDVIDEDVPAANFLHDHEREARAVRQLPKDGSQGLACLERALAKKGVTAKISRKPLPPASTPPVVRPVKWKTRDDLVKATESELTAILKKQSTIKKVTPGKSQTLQAILQRLDPTAPKQIASPLQPGPGPSSPVTKPADSPPRYAPMSKRTVRVVSSTGANLTQSSTSALPSSPPRDNVGLGALGEECEPEGTLARTHSAKGMEEFTSPLLGSAPPPPNLLTSNMFGGSYTSSSNGSPDIGDNVRNESLVGSPGIDDSPASQSKGLGLKLLKASDLLGQPIRSAASPQLGSTTVELLDPNEEECARPVTAPLGETRPSDSGKPLREKGPANGRRDSMLSDLSTDSYIRPMTSPAIGDWATLRPGQLFFLRPQTPDDLSSDLLAFGTPREPEFRSPVHGRMSRLPGMGRRPSQDSDVQPRAQTASPRLCRPLISDMSLSDITSELNEEASEIWSALESSGLLNDENNKTRRRTRTLKYSKPTLQPKWSQDEANRTLRTMSESIRCLLTGQEAPKRMDDDQMMSGLPRKKVHLSPVYWNESYAQVLASRRMVDRAGDASFSIDRREEKRKANFGSKSKFSAKTVTKQLEEKLDVFRFDDENRRELEKRAEEFAALKAEKELRARTIGEHSFVDYKRKNASCLAENIPAVRLGRIKARKSEMANHLEVVRQRKRENDELVQKRIVETQIARAKRRALKELQILQERQAGVLTLLAVSVRFKRLARTLVGGRKYRARLAEWTAAVIRIQRMYRRVMLPTRVREFVHSIRTLKRVFWRVWFNRRIRLRTEAVAKIKNFLAQSAQTATFSRAVLQFQQKVRLLQRWWRRNTHQRNMRSELATVMFSKMESQKIVAKNKKKKSNANMDVRVLPEHIKFEAVCELHQERRRQLMVDTRAYLQEYQAWKAEAEASSKMVQLKSSLRGESSESGPAIDYSTAPKRPRFRLFFTSEEFEDLYQRALVSWMEEKKRSGTLDDMDLRADKSKKGARRKKKTTSFAVKM
eukprot:Rmarinus@m.28410